ncbi:MAG: hypothetical protein OEV78_04265 [Spirochaetia bacterium]|nr:hypothetical protein [Spirochaetia bacterium]
MPKITLEINDEDMVRIKRHAEMENLSVEEFISTAALRYIDQNEFIDELQLAEILENENLLD